MKRWRFQGDPELCALREVIEQLNKVSYEIERIVDIRDSATPHGDLTFLLHRLPQISSDSEKRAILAQGLRLILHAVEDGAPPPGQTRVCL